MCLSVGLGGRRLGRCRWRSCLPLGSFLSSSLTEQALCAAPGWPWREARARAQHGGLPPVKSCPQSPERRVPLAALSHMEGRVPTSQVLFARRVFPRPYPPYSSSSSSPHPAPQLPSALLPALGLSAGTSGHLAEVPTCLLLTPAHSQTTALSPSQGGILSLHSPAPQGSLSEGPPHGLPPAPDLERPLWAGPARSPLWVRSGCTDRRPGDLRLLPPLHREGTELLGGY